jgi:hypothetical protein
MTTPADLEQFKQVLSIKEDAQGFLDEAAWYQARRWELLRRVVDDACWQYAMMRLDAVEGKEKDQGVPAWLSVLLTVGVGLIPFGELTTAFLGKATTTTARFLTRSERALLPGAKTAVLKSVDRPELTIRMLAHERLAKEIKRTEARFARWARLADPVASSTLKASSSELSKTLAKHAFKQEDGGKKLARSTTVPLVEIRQYLNQWIDGRIRAEHRSQTIIKKHIRDLADIASSSQPAKDAKAKEQQARTPMPTGSLFRPIRWEAPKLPHTNKEALTELTEVRDDLADWATGPDSIPNIEDLQDLQLLIEASIWASTYDFTPQAVRAGIGGGYHTGPRMESPPQIKGAPLPAALWKRLIERYIDPDEHKPYKDVPVIDRLGTKTEPGSSWALGQFGEIERAALLRRYGPEARLSYYFSKILYPKIESETSDVIRSMESATAAGAAPSGYSQP